MPLSMALACGNEAFRQKNDAAPSASAVRPPSRPAESEPAVSGIQHLYAPSEGRTTVVFRRTSQRARVQSNAAAPGFHSIVS